VVAQIGTGVAPIREEPCQRRRERGVAFELSLVDEALYRAG
jgi:hypothetical protein